MTRARTEGAAAALCFAAFILVSCLSAPDAPSEPAAAPAEDEAVTAAPLASESATAALPSAILPTAGSARPDPSWSRRSPIAPSLIVASLHEPATWIPTAESVAQPRREPLPEMAAAIPPFESPKAVESAPAPSSPVAAAASARAPTAPLPVNTSAVSSTAGAPAAAIPVAPKAAAAASNASSGAAPSTGAASTAADKPNSAAKAAAALPLAPYSSALAAAAQPEPPAAASRSISAEAGMRVEIPFDGTGWTYLGEKEGREGVVYEARRFEDEGLVFVLLATKPGGYTLRFQRQDALRGIAYDELVALEVAPKPAPRAEAATAVSEPGASSSAAPDPTAAPSAPAATVKAPSESPESLILGAREALASGRVQNALDALDRLLSRYPMGTDEAFYLYARALELNGPLKDIQRAYALYKKLCSDYPQSLFWDASAERVSYIERRYFDIR